MNVFSKIFKKTNKPNSQTVNINNLDNAPGNQLLEDLKNFSITPTPAEESWIDKFFNEKKLWISKFDDDVFISARELQKYFYNYFYIDGNELKEIDENFDYYASHVVISIANQVHYYKPGLHFKRR